MSKLEKESTFTGANVSLLVNDLYLGNVNNVIVEDYKEWDYTLTTRIKLNIIAFDRSQDLVEFMRKNKFSFKIMNNTTSSGWLAYNCEVEQFNMELSTNEESDGLLHQYLVIKTTSFNYTNDVRGESLAVKDQEDFENLIKILKENQNKTTKNIVLPVKMETKQSSLKENKYNDKKNPNPDMGKTKKNK